MNMVQLLVFMLTSLPEAIHEELAHKRVMVLENLKEVDVPTLGFQMK
jgi:hypothetical protein